MNTSIFNRITLVRISEFSMCLPVVVGHSTFKRMATSNDTRIRQLITDRAVRESRRFLT